MRNLIFLALSVSLYGFSGIAFAADKAFTGVFEGTGRACSGALYVRAKTIEWNSSFSICGSTSYEILERKLDNEHKRIVFRLKRRNHQCRYSIIEVEHVSGYGWNVSGYQSLDGFENKDLPDRNNSPLPERQVLSCLMVGPG